MHIFSLSYIFLWKFYKALLEKKNSNHASFSVFLIIDLYFLIPTVVTQILNPIVEHAISIEIQTKEAKAEMQTHPVIVEAKIRTCKYNL